MVKSVQLLLMAAIFLLISTLCCCGALIGQETETEVEAEAEEFISLSLEEWDQRFGSTAPAVDGVDSPTPDADPQVEEPAPVIEDPTPALTLEQAADQVVRALSLMDMSALAAYVHLTDGVRFSPYAFVDQSHLVFLPEQLAQLAQSGQMYTWGQFDGTGQDIDMTYADYHQAFVYPADFANAEAVAVNQELAPSSMINNISEFYPGSSFVEYHFSGFDEDYGGLDWRSLRLVFVPEGDTWYLVGIVGDQWTT